MSADHVLRGPGAKYLRSEDGRARAADEAELAEWRALGMPASDCDDEARRRERARRS